MVRHNEPQPPGRERPDDEALLGDGQEALRRRLGIVGSLRFLRLISGERDNFEDIRRAWEDLSVDEILVPDNGDVCWTRGRR